MLPYHPRRGIWGECRVSRRQRRIQEEERGHRNSLAEKDLECKSLFSHTKSPVKSVLFVPVTKWINWGAFKEMNFENGSKLIQRKLYLPNNLLFPLTKSGLIYTK